MVRLVNLDDECCEEHVARFGGGGETRMFDDVKKGRHVVEDEGVNLNYGTAFARALGCYPIISTIATTVDLTTLHNLALTCRQVRANLLAHRNTLVSQTLRCENETADPALRLGNALQASFRQWTSYAQTGDQIGRVSGGKVGACVRDLVGECRRCGRVVCRNCVTKPPTPTHLRARLRRLCRTCLKSPLQPHILSPSSPHPFDESTAPAKPRAAPRTPCTCPTTPWLCRPCALPARTADTTYMRGWAWRTRYSACGGIGAGLGEGNEGVECGRGGACLAARVVEKESECDGETGEATGEGGDGGGCCGDAGREWAGSSYRVVEVVGIGGVVRRKVKEGVWVGGVVEEFEDERVGGEFLGREGAGGRRAWCAWCERVVFGGKDGEASGEGKGETVGSAGSSSP